MQGALDQMHIEVGSIFKIRLTLRMFVTVKFCDYINVIDSKLMKCISQIIEFAYKCLTLLKTAV